MKSTIFSVLLLLSCNAFSQVEYPCELKAQGLSIPKYEYKLLQRSMSYPEKALREGIQGCVLVVYNFENDWKIQRNYLLPQNIQVLESPSELLSDEVLRTMARSAIPNNEVDLASGSKFYTIVSFTLL